MTVRRSKSCVGAEEKEALARVIDAGYLGMGREVQQLEDELTAYLGEGRSVLCVNTGTAALQLALQAIGVGPGDEVLVPSITYVASYQAISATGARPLSCEVTPDRVFLDVADAERRITPRTRAIMPVHYASDSQDMPAVYAVAHRHGLRVVEDAAHGFGGTRGGRRIGSAGDVSCFSFDGIKNITCGEGGAVVTADPEVARRVRDARLLGVEKDTEQRYRGERSWTFDVSAQGWRYHMSNLMAAIGRAQLAKLERFSAHRRRCVARYREALGGMDGLRLLDLDWNNLVPHIFVVRVLGGSRAAVMSTLRSEGIECGIHYQPNHTLRYFASSYALPVSERLGEELLTLPLHAELTDTEQDRVIAALRGALR